MKTSRAPKTVLKFKKISATLLKTWSLPKLDDQSDKASRGEITVIAGSFGMPGAAILSAVAALRAGAGKLQVATSQCVATMVAQAVPESLVIVLKEEEPGVLSKSAGKSLAKAIEKSNAVLIGCGMESSAKASARILGTLKTLLLESADKTIVIDAAAMGSLKNQFDLAKNSRASVIITPHAGEMASFTGHTKDFIQKNARQVAREVAQKYHVIVVMKGHTTVVTDGGNTDYFNTNGNAGLGTSGSGDVLAGIIAGLSARGAEPMQAAVWGVHLHALAGERLAKTIGPLGYLASEISREIPALMNQLS